MRRVLAYLPLVLSIAGSPRALPAQVLLEPFDVAIDARTVTLGEAGVALATPQATFVNPAGLAPLRGITATAARRIIAPYTRVADATIHDATVTFGTTALGTFGIETMEESVREADAAPTGDFHATRTTLAWATPISATMDAGVALGIASAHDRDYTTGGDAAATTGFAGAGVRYHESLLHTTAVRDEFAFGFSLTNLGGTLRAADDSTLLLPRAFRAGVTWIIAEPETTVLGTTGVSGRIVGQYQNILNFTNTSSKGFWSAGIEIGIYDLLDVRYGLYYRPYESRYSITDNGQANAGVGVHLPLGRVLGMTDYPLEIRIDYGAAFLRNGGNDNLVTVGLAYGRDLLPSSPPAP